MLIMRQFESKMIRILVVSDPLSSVLDFTSLQNLQLSMIINYDLPMKSNTFLDRINHMKHFHNCASMNFVTPDELVRQGEIESLFGFKIDEMV